MSWEFVYFWGFSLFLYELVKLNKLSLFFFNVVTLWVFLLLPVFTDNSEFLGSLLGASYAAVFVFLSFLVLHLNTLSSRAFLLKKINFLQIPAMPVFFLLGFILLSLSHTYWPEFNQTPGLTFWQDFANQDFIELEVSWWYFFFYHVFFFENWVLNLMLLGALTSSLTLLFFASYLTKADGALAFLRFSNLNLKPTFAKTFKLRFVNKFRRQTRRKNSQKIKF